MSDSWHVTLSHGPLGERVRSDIWQWGAITQSRGAPAHAPTKHAYHGEYEQMTSAWDYPTSYKIRVTYAD